MRKRVFWKVIFILLPILFLVNAGSLSLAYKLLYDAAIEGCQSTAYSVAISAAEIFSFYDPYKISDSEKCNSEFEKMCKSFDFSYIYAIMPDEAAETITYLSIGFGKNATDEAISKRKAGVSVNSLNPQIKSAFHGESEKVYKRTTNEFGDTLTCYYPVFRYYNSGNGQFVYETVSVVGVDISISEIMKSFRSQYVLIIIFNLSFSLISLLVVGWILYYQVSKPLGILNNRMTRFVFDRDKAFKKLEFKGNSEITDLSKSFNYMAEEIDDYISHISELTKEKLTQETELSIASDIQTGLLQSPYFCFENLSVNARMFPAKTVGGDLYDYQLTDDGRLFLSIADVSGKGITAALFMARAVTLIHQFASHGYAPSEMLEEFNDCLAANNPNGLFITAFVAVFDPKTSMLTYSNAGHNIPYLLSDKLNVLNGAQGMAAGVFPGEKYPEATVPFCEDDTLFLYTDGVNEAENTALEFFGNEALEQVLKTRLKCNNDDLIDIVFARINEFSAGSVQNDDITMLTFQRHSNAFMRTVVLTSQKEQLSDVFDMIQNCTHISEDIRSVISLAAEEIFINICSYAYDGDGGEVQITLEVTEDMVWMTFTDNGKPFDPTSDVLNIDTYDIQNKIGGLGRFLTFSLMDSFTYEYCNEKNILRIGKKQQ